MKKAKCGEILRADYIKHMDAFRICDNAAPDWTIAYENRIIPIAEWALKQGYKEIIISYPVTHTIQVCNLAERTSTIVEV